MRIKLKKYDFRTLKSAYLQDRGLVVSYPEVMKRLVDYKLMELCGGSEVLGGLVYYRITYAGKKCVEHLERDW